MFRNITPFKKLMQFIYLKIPVIRKIIMYSEVSMFAKTFASLLNHGVFITDCMDVLIKVSDNEIYKGIYRMRNGISYDVNSKGGVGLHVLNLTFQSYNLLREKHFNTVQDLISVCTYRLYSLTGSVCFTDILRKVHFLGYKFIDEQDKDIDDLRNTDLKKLVKSYKSIRK